jgi:HemY protein
MLRLIVFLITVAIVAAGLAWLADRPGELIVEWQGYHAEMSVFYAIVALVAVVVTALIVWSLFRNLWNSPAAVGGHFAKRRQRMGIDALSSGMIALGAGDRSAATRAALQARKSLPNEPLTHLLRAQAAQLSGDRVTARRVFEAMLAAPDTEQLGLRGLFLEAQREGETEAARHFAERAVGLNPKLSWAVDALFELQCRQSDWAGALETLAIARKQGHLNRAAADRRRAVLLTAQAQAAEDGDPERALNLALEAHGLAPSLVPAAAIAGRILASRGNTPRAAKVLQKTWARAPHPDLATAYAFARIGDSPRDRLDRVKHLAGLAPNSAEGPIAVANAAIESRQYDEARDALKALMHGRMSQRVATLMARIEGEEHGDKGRVREWLARAVNAPRDPAWTADGIVSEHWAPISPVTGALDAFQWRVPVENVEKSEGDVLASKLEELVALGMPRHGPGDDEPQTIDVATAPAQAPEPAKMEPTDRDEAVTKTEPASAKPTAPKPEPVTRQAAPAAASATASTGQSASARRRASERSKEKRIYVAPTAPDDPGPEAGDPEDAGMTMRPKPA